MYTDPAPSFPIANGGTITFECQSGYRMTGSADVTCTGSVLGTLPVCEGKFKIYIYLTCTVQGDF